MLLEADTYKYFFFPFVPGNVHNFLVVYFAPK